MKGGYSFVRIYQNKSDRAESIEELIAAGYNTPVGDRRSDFAGQEVG